ncbi:hypothetical protein TorRG33x02_306060 [Trema orientale]|uniref:Uncharacterized protein n=1 Tax=Trema orientale TaxID=63057 RepID=A0A2P5BWT1_TREOI|nr:hypothetical protein TorRG33x02_306060 [Trema orientale]
MKKKKKKKKILPKIVNQDLEFLRSEALKVRSESVYHSVSIDGCFQGLLWRLLMDVFKDLPQHLLMDAFKE